MEITKEQILEIVMWGNSNDRLKVKRWFPEAFKVELEVGKWYFHNKSTAIVNYQGNSSGYGFNALDNWCSIPNFIIWTFETRATDWRLATTQECQSALIEEAKKRGYIGNYIKNIEGDNKGNVSKYSITDFKYESGEITGINEACDYTLFKDGVWAEIIKTFSKEEAEKLLGGKII
jgi:hypothetical protein